MERIGSIINKTLNRKGYRKKLLESKARLYWRDIVGENIARSAYPAKVERGVMIVFTVSPIWAEELSGLKQDILDKINNFLGRKVIHDIKFYYRSELEKGLKLDKKSKSASELIAERITTDEDMKRIKDISRNIKDKELRKSLEKVLIKEFQRDRVV